jgi:hypothetical protein
MDVLRAKLQDWVEYARDLKTMSSKERKEWIQLTDEIVQDIEFLQLPQDTGYTPATFQGGSAAPVAFQSSAFDDGNFLTDLGFTALATIPPPNRDPRDR